MRRLASILAVVLLVASPAVARKGAEPSADAKKAAKDHFKAAEWLFAQRMYGEAILEYQAAYNAWPVDALYFNIAQCHRNLGHVDEAIDAFERYLKSPKAETNRDEVEELLAQLRRRKEHGGKGAGGETGAPTEVDPTASRPRKTKSSPVPVAATASTAPAHPGATGSSSGGVVVPEPIEPAASASARRRAAAAPASAAPPVAAAAASAAPSVAAGREEPARAVALVPSPERESPGPIAARPIYKKPWFWVVTGSALVVVAGGAALVATETGTRLPAPGSLGLVDWR
jgi:tetratricopeptide (TPR) repeat protein